VRGKENNGGRKDEWVPKNFVDIKVKIHNKIQNIESQSLNRHSLYLLLRKSEIEGFLFVVNASELSKVSCVSKI